MSTTRKASAGLASLARILVQPTTPAAKPKGKERKATPRAAGPRPGAEGDRTEQIAVKLPATLAKRMRTVVYFVPGETVTSLVERAVLLEVDRLEAKHGPFDEGGPVKRGRPARR